MSKKSGSGAMTAGIVLCIVLIGGFFYFKNQQNTKSDQKAAAAGSIQKEIAQQSAPQLPPPMINQQPKSGKEGCGTVTDADGNVYDTVMVGAKCWMAQNMMAKTYSNAIAIANVGSSAIPARYCYANPAGGDYCNTEGALYSWWSAVGLPENSPKEITGPVQGLCPDGWHVPTDMDWTALTNAYATTNELINGADGSIGFNAQYSGYYSGDSFLGHGDNNYFWTSTMNDSKSSFFWSFSKGLNYMSRDFTDLSIGYSVRCVKG